MPILRPRKARPTTPTSSGIIFISLTAIAPTGFAGSSMMARLCSTSMIWNGKSVKLSPVRLSFGSRQIVAIRRLSSAAMLRKCSVWKTASSIWREKRCLSVWFIFNVQRLCLRVQPLNYHLCLYTLQETFYQNKMNSCQIFLCLDYDLRFSLMLDGLYVFLHSIFYQCNFVIRFYKNSFIISVPMRYNIKKTNNRRTIYLMF